MNSITILTLALLATATQTVDAFAPCPSTFAGRASSVHPKAVETTKYTFGHDSMSMTIPFLRRFPNVFRRRSANDDEASSVAVLEPPTAAVSADIATLEPVTETQGVKSEATDLTSAVAKVESEEEQTETQKLMKQVKEAGLAGVISYALWELGFWTVSVPVCIFGYREVTGHWPDLSNKDDIAKLSAEAFAFVNFARFAVPLRIGLALSTTPWIQQNIVDRFFNKEESDLANDVATNGSSSANGESN